MGFRSFADHSSRVLWGAQTEGVGFLVVKAVLSELKRLQAVFPAPSSAKGREEPVLKGNWIWCLGFKILNGVCGVSGTRRA